MTQSSAVHEQVQSQFGPVASQYTASTGHADAAALARVVALAEVRPSDRVLDIGTGAGHTALALAPHVAEVVAYDLTPAMLAEVERSAAARGVANIRTRRGAAEALPFADGEFDRVTVRLASHHFGDICRAVEEMSRVLKPGGRAVVIDSTVPEDDTLDREFNRIEKLRDPSHVRNYRPSEWRAMLQDAGPTVTHGELSMYSEGDRMSFDTWTARMRTPPAAVVELEGIFHGASPALREALDIAIVNGKIAFRVPLVILVALKNPNGRAREASG